MYSWRKRCASWVASCITRRARSVKRSGVPDIFGLRSGRSDRPSKELVDRAVQQADQPFELVFNVVVRPELAGPTSGCQLAGSVFWAGVGCVNRNLLPTRFERAIRAGGIPDRGKRLDEGGERAFD